MDPKPALEKACHTPCVPLWDNYKKCEGRVTAKGDGDCSPWYFDYWKCVDKCVRDTCPLICVPPEFSVGETRHKC